MSRWRGRKHHVVHLSPEKHALAKQLADSEEKGLGELVEELLDSRAAVIQRRAVNVEGAENDNTEAWSLPPFWERGR